MLLSVFRNMSQALLYSFLNSKVGNILSIHNNLAFLYLWEAWESIKKFCLSVTVNTCNTNNLSFSDRKGKILYLGDSQTIVDSNVFYLQSHLSWLTWSLVYIKLDRASYHHGSQLLFICFRGNINSSDILSTPQDSTSICHGHDFFQLMSDDHYRLTLFLESSNDFHQLVDFLWCQNSCRFIQDNDIGVWI